MFFDPFAPPTDYHTPPPTPPHGYSCNCCPNQGCTRCRRLCDCNNGDMRCTDSDSDEEFETDDEEGEEYEYEEGEEGEWEEDEDMESEDEQGQDEQGRYSNYYY